VHRDARASLRRCAFLNPRGFPFRSLADGAGPSKTRFDVDVTHLGERVQRLAFLHNWRLAFAKAGLRVGLLRQGRTPGVENHAFRPFVIRVDPNVDLMI
jgi:hypothetical protein